MSALFALLALFSAAAFSQDYQVRDFDKWLNYDVAYIISDYEKHAFEMLKTDAQRRRYVEAFWVQRDPSPGTEANEYLQEHYRRIEYARKNFSEAEIDGVLTERGRAYITMGEPVEKINFVSHSLVSPMMAWLYTPDYSSGIRYEYFLLFYRPKTSDRYVIYRPSQNDPHELLANDTTFAGSKRDEKALNELFKIDSTLAQLALSSLPGEHKPIMIGNSAEIRRALSRRSKSSLKVIDSLFNSRNFMQTQRFREIEGLLAGRRIGHFGRAVRVNPNYSYQLDVLRNDRGNPGLYLTVILDPRAMGLTETHGLSYSSLTMTVTIEGQYGQRLEKQDIYTIGFNSWEVHSGLLGMIILTQDMIVPSGQYTVTVKVENTKWFKYFEFQDEITIPVALSNSIAVSRPVLLAKGINQAQSAFRTNFSYVFNGLAYVPEARRIVMNGLNSNVFYQIYFPQRERGAPIRVTYEILSNRDVFWNAFEDVQPGYISQTGVFMKSIRIPTGKLPPGSYRLNVTAVSSTTNDEVTQGIDFAVGEKELKLVLPSVVMKSK